MSNLKLTVCSNTTMYSYSLIIFFLGTINNFLSLSTFIKVEDDFYLLHVNTMNHQMSSVTDIKWRHDISANEAKPFILKY